MGNIASQIKGFGVIYEKTQSICVINFKKACHNDVVFELFCVSMCLMALDNNNLKKKEKKDQSEIV